RLADTLDLRQKGGGRAEHAGERAEPVEQRLGDRFRVAARDKAEEDELKQFVVGECSVAVFAKAGTKPLAVTVIMSLRCPGAEWHARLAECGGFCRPLSKEAALGVRRAVAVPVGPVAVARGRGVLHVR